VTLARRAFVQRAAALTLGAAASGTRAAAAAAGVADVRVLAVPTDGVKSLLYAQRAGLFRNHGITAGVVAMGSGAAIFSAIIGGSADIGSGSLFPVFAAYARGVPLRIIAPASLYASDHADKLLLVQKDGPLRSARDLNGKTIGVDAVKDVNGTATRAWLDLHGGDGSTLRLVELRPAEQLSALDAGRVDSVVLQPPFLTVALESGRFRVLGRPLDAIAPRFLLSSWVASADYIARNPETVSAFATALAEAARYTNAHQAATTEMVAAFTGLDPAVLGRGVRSTTAESITLADVQRPLDFALKNGIIDRPFDVSGLLWHPRLSPAG
jgi:NitT/TauT family transport system substrate-binding protein